MKLPTRPDVSLIEPSDDPIRRDRATPEWYEDRTGYVGAYYWSNKEVGPRISGMALTLLASVATGSVAQTLPLQFGGGDLIWLAVLFLILAFVAGLLGARGVAGLSMSIAKWLVIIFVVLAILTFFL